MKYLNIEQCSQEWFEYKAGKISGTRFGQMISSRENSIVPQLIDETLNGYVEPSDYEDEDILFGKENESIAIDLYEEMSGLKFERGGVIQSGLMKLSMSSPDGISFGEKKIVVEVKCTRNGHVHISRFLKGIDTSHKPQIINYFFSSDMVVDEVHFISYCPYRPERPIVVNIVTKDTLIYDSARKKQTVADVCSNSIRDYNKLELDVETGLKLFTEIEF